MTLKMFQNNTNAIAAINEQINDFFDEENPDIEKQLGITNVVKVFNDVCELITIYGPFDQFIEAEDYAYHLNLQFEMDEDRLIAETGLMHKADFKEES